MTDPAPGILLLRLPSLVKLKIVKQMYLWDQYELAGLSKRSQYLVKTANHREKIDLNFNFKAISKVAVGNRTMMEAFTTEFESFEHAKLCIQLLNETFNLTPVRMDFINCHPNYYNLIPFLKQNGVKIDEISVFGNKNQLLGQKDYKTILAGCGDVRKVSIMMKTFPNFRIDIPTVFQCDTLYLDDARWVTVDHLVNCFMDCKKLILNSSKIFFKNLRPFILKWIEGCRIENFSIPIKHSTGQVTHTSFQEIFRGLRAPQVREVTLGDKSCLFSRGECFLLRDVNGKEAIVINGFNVLCLTTHAVVIQRW